MKSPHHKDPIKIEKTNGGLVLKWGSKEKRGLKIGTILFSAAKLGGRKKRTRRRKKRRRKRTKKRR